MDSDRVLIGEGHIARIYAEGKYALKVFREGYPQSWIEYEARIQKEVSTQTSLHVPKIIEVTSAREIKMDYIEGITLGNRMRVDKYKQGLEDFIQLQLQVYQYHSLDLPQAHALIKEKISKSDLSDGIKTKALESLELIEEKDVLCHFDFHFLNIMFDKKEYHIIDWVNAKLGNPVLDIAATHIILTQHAKRMANKYLREIAKAGGFSLDEIQKAIPVMAAMRMLDNDIYKEDPVLLAIINQ